MRGNAGPERWKRLTLVSLSVVGGLVGAQKLEKVSFSSPLREGLKYAEVLKLEMFLFSAQMRRSAPSGCCTLLAVLTVASTLRASSQFVRVAAG